MKEDSTAGTFQHRLRSQLLIGNNQAQAVQNAAKVVNDYHSGTLTGPAFDSYGDNDPYRITSDDLIAITMLSIAIRESSSSSLRPTSIRMLKSYQSAIADKLSDLPADRDLHSLTSAEFDRWLGPGSSGDSLYWLLRNDVSIPRVAVYKLLARKRPLLMPIRDTVVEKALKQTASAWWRPWRDALASDPTLVRDLADIRESAHRPHLSLLRVADIVIWMRNWKPRGAAASSRDAQEWLSKRRPNSRGRGASKIE